MEGRQEIWENASLATMRQDGSAYGALRDGAIVVADGRISWLGARRELPPLDAVVRHDMGARWITPGLIDCHTHLVFAGDRAGEFELRLKGASYEDIARAGGGIRSTVNSTRAASEDELFHVSRARLTTLMAGGVTTVDIKSGYGLDIETEAKMLRVARRLGTDAPVTVRTSFLGAHALPPEYEGRQAAYIDLVTGEMLQRIAAEGLADAVDAFGEKIAFTPAEIARVFEAAQRLGLPVKLHADQLSDQGGAGLAARFGALSADHLEYASEAGVAAMAAHGVVAVLLPCAFYFLRETKKPPVEHMRTYGAPIAIATDCNPGTSPSLSLPLAMNMACTLFQLTPEEALAGVTRNAARALGLSDRGVLDVGKIADLAVWDIGHPAELAYWIGGAQLFRLVKDGVELRLDGSRSA